MDFPAGYGNAIVSYIALLVLCYMGQNIDSAVYFVVNFILKFLQTVTSDAWIFLQNETICDALANMKWYCLPLSKQKDVAHILNRMQNGVVLTQVGEGVQVTFLEIAVHTQLNTLDSLFQGPFNALNYDMASTVIR